MGKSQKPERHIVDTNYFSVNIREYENLDPFFDIELSDEDRERMNSEAHEAFLNYADYYLSQFGAYMLGNGDVVGPVNPKEEGYLFMDDSDVADFRNYIDSWYASDLVQKWLDHSDRQYGA